MESVWCACRSSIGVTLAISLALMAELADAQDLKSCVLWGRPSSSLGGCMWLGVTPNIKP